MSTLAVTLLALGLIVATPDSPADLPEFSDEIFVVGEGPLVVPVSPGDEVRVDFGVGSLDIRASDAHEVRAEIEVSCRRVKTERCQNYRKRIKVEPVETERGIEIRMTGLRRQILRRLEVTGRVRVPKDSPLAVKIGIGAARIEAGDADVAVRMGIGDLRITKPQETVRSVAVRTGIGDASVRASGEPTRTRRKRLIGAQASWSGDGAAAVAARLRIGDARVVLVD